MPRPVCLFTGQWADLPLEKLSVLVGNQRGAALERVPLRDVLSGVRGYLHEPGSWKGDPLLPDLP